MQNNLELKEHPGHTFLFSYGSNNPHQAAERLEVEYDWLCQRTVACEAVDHILTFGLNSGRWGGGVANLQKQPGKSCPGLAYLLPNDILSRMDKFQGWYVRQSIKLSANGKEFQGIAYIQEEKSQNFIRPSKKYLFAIAKTLIHYYRCRGTQKQHIEIPIIDTNNLEHHDTETIPLSELEAQK